jgi:hypothetical protein
MPGALRSRTLFCVAITLTILLQGSAQYIVHAQSTWPPATILWQAESGTGPYSNNAADLVTDPAGAVHLAWLNFPTEVGNSGDQVLMYYSRWDGQAWTNPVDIFVGTGAQPLGSPVLLPTDEGRLHILWLSGAGLMHSSAWADDAARPQAWSPPVAATAFPRPVFNNFDAAVDARGVFHAVYAEKIGEVYYIRSEDQGETWSQPIAVSAVPPEMTSYKPRLAVAPDGRIHVVWTETSPTDDVRMARIRYSFSTDGGNSWSDAREFGEIAHSDASVVAFDGNEVYIAWNASTATSGGRYLSYSNDGGVTWGGSMKFSQRAGLSGFPSIARDSLGRLHLLTGDGEYTTWDGHNFTPVLALSPFDAHTENSRLTVANGNTLVAVFPPFDGIVYTAVRQLDVPTIPAHAPPPHAEETAQPAATEGPPAGTNQPAATPVAETGGLNTAAPAVASSSTTPIVLSTASALAIVLVVVAWNRLGRKR